MPFTVDQIDTIGPEKDTDYDNQLTCLLKDGRKYRINLDRSFDEFKEMMPKGDKKKARLWTLQNSRAFTDGSDTWLYCQPVELNQDECF